MSELTHALRTPDADSKLRIQRKCGCGGSCGSCSEEEKKKKVQRRALGDTGNDIPRSVQSILGSAGRPLDAETLATMESRFGRSFAEVRVHTDSHAAASAHDISAAAYTAGTHIVFGAGRFEPDTAQGRRLLAHELAHVAQQTSGASTIAHGIGPADDVHERAADRVADAVVAQGPAFAPPPAIVPVAERLVRRKREESEPAVEVEPRFIVDDALTPAPGQMRRKEFVEELDAAICATSNREMARLGQSTDNCPLLAKWRPRIAKMSTRELEVSMRRWVGGDASVRNAHDYIPRVAARLAESIRIWGATGNVTGVPPELMDLLDGGGGKIRIGVGSLLRGAVGRLFRKSRDGAAAPVPTGSGAFAAFDARGGQPLDNVVASRMGRALGRDFADVRIHTDADAAAAATSMNARAFTVGQDIAFAGGEYAPGTLVGDALLAHELAHVAQQDGAEEALPKSESATGALEEDADAVAVHAVTSLWPSLRRFTRDMRSNAMPRLKSSLKLQRCDASSSELQQYLGVLDRTKKIEDHNDSDDKARQVAAAWSKGDTQYILTARRKKLLIEEMLDGELEDDDQKQILNLLERSWDDDLKHMLGPEGVSHKTLLTRFKSSKKALWSFYMRRYWKAYPEAIRVSILTQKLEPQPPPDLTELDATEPSGNPNYMVQFGDPLPKTTLATDITTKRTGEKLSKEQALRWITQEYGKLISKEQTATAEKRKVDYKEGSAFSDRFIDACLVRTDGSARDRELCEVQERTVAGFHDPTHNLITLRKRSDPSDMAPTETPSTMVHEVFHALANDRVEELGTFGREGLTEYLSRRVILRHKHKRGERPLYIGGHYDNAYDAVQELAIVVGPDLLARVHFQGAVKELCTKLGKAKFDAWRTAMQDRDNGQEATRILRDEIELEPAKGTCK